VALLLLEKASPTKEDDMRKRTSTFTAFAAAGLLALVPAFAQKQGTTDRGTHDHGSHGSTMGPAAQSAIQDEKFFVEAASGGMLEVELGRLATERATSAEVKAFGQRMVTDHGRANQQLLQIAVAQGKTAPKEMLPEHRQHRDQLARLKGAEFDRMYMQHMVQDHKKDVSEFEKQAANGSDPALRSFAQETLPVLREHLTLAQTLAGKHAKKR
jgi:putative membrane protein